MTDDGGAAFPLPEPHGYGDRKDRGMSLRDYFAAAALTALNANAPIEDVAERAYQVADAMLAERAK